MALCCASELLTTNSSKNRLTQSIVPAMRVKNMCHTVSAMVAPAMLHLEQLLLTDYESMKPSTHNTAETDTLGHTTTKIIETKQLRVRRDLRDLHHHPQHHLMLGKQPQQLGCKHPQHP